MTIEEAKMQLQQRLIDDKAQELEEGCYCYYSVMKEAEEVAIEALKYKSFADNAIKVLCNQIADERDEYHANVQRCIERLENKKGKYFDDLPCDGMKIRINDAIAIVKEEMGV